MNRDDYGFPVQLQICYYCGGDAGILLHRRAVKNWQDSEKYPSKVVIPMHGCSKCEEALKSGIAILKSSDGKKPNEGADFGVMIIREAAMMDFLKNHTDFPEDSIEEVRRRRHILFDDDAFQRMWDNAHRAENAGEADG